MSTNHNLFQEKGEPKRYRTEVLTARPNRLTFSETYGTVSYGSGWRKDAVHQCLQLESGEESALGASSAVTTAIHAKPLPEMREEGGWKGGGGYQQLQAPSTLLSFLSRPVLDKPASACFFRSGATPRYVYRGGGIFVSSAGVVTPSHGRRVIQRDHYAMKTTAIMIRGSSNKERNVQLFP